MNVLHSYKLTRFSNLVQRPEIQRPFYTLTNLQGSQTNWDETLFDAMFYTLTNLQGSQTILTVMWRAYRFYTLTNLQGSQTSNEIITEPQHTGNMRKIFSNV